MIDVVMLMFTYVCSWLSILAGHAPSNALIFEEDVGGQSPLDRLPRANVEEGEGDCAGLTVPTLSATAKKTWRCLKTAAGQHEDVKELVDWAMRDIAGCEQELHELRLRVVAEMALGRELGDAFSVHCLPLAKISNPFVRDYSMAASLDGSFVHAILKESDAMVDLQRLSKM